MPPMPSPMPPMLPPTVECVHARHSASAAATHAKRVHAFSCKHLGKEFHRIYAAGATRGAKYERAAAGTATEATEAARTAHTVWWRRPTGLKTGVAELVVDLSLLFIR